MAQTSTAAFHEFAQEVRAGIEAALEEYTDLMTTAHRGCESDSP